MIRRAPSRLLAAVVAILALFAAQFAMAAPTLPSASHGMIHAMAATGSCHESASPQPAKGAHPTRDCALACSVLVPSDAASGEGPLLSPTLADDAEPDGFAEGWLPGPTTPPPRSGS
ncbi:hypothetical protein OLX02_06795 [Novosphingobium sp. KCTC 2891]|uniref:hypothetical protein n=1 Tax=Novosphingobium sp. KCTC 2891 TaxID=2989730 RepID=UPI0022224C71|nr:hypothetical protein [Novosphingobium sp. KCTC 2891]MCW1382525.1 hypothetical protein [Novosphingobium sp. KCTC 2891]